MPLHQGHIFLCDLAASMVDRLTILVCTRDCEPIDGQLRLHWVQQELGHKANVVHLDRDVPQEPSDHPDFWNIWRDLIAEFHPAPIDMVFGSETYVTKLAQTVSARPFIVDLDRTTVPVSASDIRADPVKHWAHVPPPVRTHYQKRFCIIGPESCGKTVLAGKLAQDFETLCIPEYGRQYDAQFREGTGWCAEDFVELATGHMAIADQVARRAGPVVFEDTDVLQTMVWAKYLLGQVPQRLTELSKTKSQRHYILLSPDVPWINDGTRYQNQSSDRLWFFDQCLEFLENTQARFDVVSGVNWDDRLAQVREIVKANGATRLSSDTSLGNP